MLHVAYGNVERGVCANTEWAYRMLLCALCVSVVQKRRREELQVEGEKVSGRDAAPQRLERLNVERVRTY